ncbi:SAV1978 family virulence-associated passenger protein [Staphylococcus pettenkoferi]
MIDYFKNKHYLLNNDGKRVAHVHIINGLYKVCGHYRTMYHGLKFRFNKSEFEQFLKHNKWEVDDTWSNIQ